jgi:hypothetical protein
MAPAPETPDNPAAVDDSIDLKTLVRRLVRGSPVVIVLMVMGASVGALLSILAGPFSEVTTTTRVAFSFPGFEKGEYPDKSKFQPEDLRAPDVVASAIQHLSPTNRESLALLRSGLSVEPIIPPAIIRERDRLRAAGQTSPIFVPDEYFVTLTLSRRIPLTIHQREVFLAELVSAFRERFTRSYVSVPLTFGTAFDALKGADYFDYEIVLNQESQSIGSYLAKLGDEAKTFRSPTTNMTFGDLIKQNQLFTQIRLNETLGLIRQFGLSKDRNAALLKMDYYLRILTDRENAAAEQERVVQELLQQSQERAQSYVVGLKSQATKRPDSPVIDQGLVDSLLANDSYNFLVREALAAGLRTRQIKAEKLVLLDRRNSMETFVRASQADQREVIEQLDRSLAALRVSYTELIGLIRRTHEDYQHQRFADAVRITMEPTTPNTYLFIGRSAGIGALVAGGLASALAMLGFSLARRP